MINVNQYQRILNPETGRWVTTDGRIGKRILRNYQFQSQLGGGEDADSLRTKIKANLQEFTDYQSKEFDRARKLEQEAHQLERRAHKKKRNARHKIGALIIEDRANLTRSQTDDPICVLTKHQGTCEPNDNLSTDEYYHETGKEFCTYNSSKKLCEFGRDGANHNLAKATREPFLKKYDSDPNFVGEDAIFWRDDDDGNLEPFYSYHNPEELLHLVPGRIHDPVDDDDSNSDISSNK